MLNISANAFIFLAIFYTVLFIFSLRNKKIDKKRAKFNFVFYIEIMAFSYTYYILQNIFDIETLFIVFGILFGISSIITLKIFKYYKKEYNIVFLFYLIGIIELSYVSYTPFYTRQHDARSFESYQHGGHYGYLGYIFYNNSLPNFSPKDYWCFANPPLFYIISVCFIKIQSFFGRDLWQCFENLQFLSFIYSMIINFYVFRILKRLKIKESIATALSIVFFAPALIIMCGSINNDMLSIMFQTMAIFYAIKWQETTKLSDLIKVAITIGLAMMTKISSAVVAVAISYIFIKKVIEDRQNIKKYIINFAIFALIALPIGLWFPVKNLILYDVPLTYIQSVGPENEANISEYGVFDRFFTINSIEELKDMNVIMTGENKDYNLFIATIKSFIVDEKIECDNNIVLKTAVHAIFYLSFIIGIMFIINLVFALKNYKENKDVFFFIILFMLEIIAYIKFCFNYPFVFTMNFRYIVPTLISYAAITGMASDKNKKLLYINSGLNLLFCILSITIFTLMR